MMKAVTEKNLTADNEDKYLRRCIRMLKTLDLPVTGWTCIEVYDCREDDDEAPLEVCEVCGCDRVRYVHVMYHPDFFIDLHVGCICAGVMEGDILQAKERERLMQNRARRKSSFMKRKWERVRKGCYTMTYKHQRLFLVRTDDNEVEVSCGRKYTTMYKGHPITNYKLASHAIFDLIDPYPEVIE